VDIADGHYFYTSSAFWGVAVGVIVGVLGIAATIWVTLRAANPKRCLYYVMRSDTPLINRRNDLSEQLKVSYGNAQLDSPHVVTIRLVSRGRADIAREAFDGDRPLILDLGTSIVELVEIATSPSDRPDPEWTLKGSELQVGPSHFGRRQTTDISLLVDGDWPRIVPPKQTLIDVRLEHGNGESIRQMRAIIAIPLWFVFLMLPVTGVIAYRTHQMATRVALAEYAAIIALGAVGTAIYVRKATRGLTDI